MSHTEQKQKLEAALYVVATPIGNLRDMTLRARDILSEVDVIAAEDTRNTAHLLTHFGIHAKRLLALHQHNERSAAEKILHFLRDGLSVALVTDAGTPAVSDPGAVLVAEVQAAGQRIIPIPGCSAAITALSASGLASPHFLFYGFLPNKPAARRTVLQSLRGYPETLVFYEAPHRILESVEDLLQVLGEAREIVFARELTKLFESIHRCRLGEATPWLKADPNHQRGEFVLLVSGALLDEEGLPEEVRQTLKILLDALPLKQAVQLAVQITGANKNELYSLALSLKQDSEEE